MGDFKVITDLRVLNAICKKYNFIVDKNFKYLLKGYMGFCCRGELCKKGTELYYKNKVYEISYFSGCFNPFIIEVTK